jgi:colanic acid biosynthesis glycosyl transferase WcaI
VTTDLGSSSEKTPARRRRIVVISQTFVPDPASVGQHMTDVARELARRGYEVRVYASARGYEDPTAQYPRREFMDAGGGRGVDVRRLPLASFGKKSILIRVFGTASFHLQVLWHLLLTPRVAGIFFSTSPPLVGVMACVAQALRGMPIVYWAMDLNPDQLIVMGKLRENSLTARFLEAANRLILRRSALIVALDRFMQGRLLTRGDFADKMLVMPPWPHDENIDATDPSKETASSVNPFREKHGLAGKCVIMYSGNHSPANPLSTLLEAAVEFKNDDRVRFVFVGGGAGKKEVDACIRQHGLTNMLSLPYQPLADLKYSLAAADVHVVSMGQHMAGIIHPCKIYGAMSVARPVLYLGPSPSHVSDILEAHGCGWQVSHGDVAAMKQRIEAILALPPADLQRMGQAAQQALRGSLSQEILLKRLGDRLEQVFPPPLADQPRPVPQ